MPIQNENGMTSVSLLERVRTGNAEKDWSTFVEIYTPLIERWLIQRGVPQHDAEDTRQEALAVVIQELPQFQHNGRVGAFRNWLKMITTHRLRTIQRRQRRAADGTDLGTYDDLCDQMEDPHSELSENWNKEHDRFVLNQLLERVADDERSLTIFRRLTLQERSPAEVAEEFGITRNTVAIVKSRMLTRLKHEAEGLLDITIG